ncbi:hypothetical protein B0T14DRAFT_493931 [Immersiella caudata]|uniref:Uncharacterized protein n=1 Tax=Immersiella caudata TaxID=314043 RepID=A0AA40C7Y6_9PEZI|nr:hypothetical protein B0T14DRAFT_493931 [Immersiella caudata]
MATPGAAATHSLGAYPWQGHRYQPVESDLDERPRSVSPLSHATTVSHAASAVPGIENTSTPTSSTTAIPPDARGHADDGNRDNGAQWTPPYLGRFVIVGFVLVFALVLIVIEVLLAHSNNHDGLATGYAGQQYLWTYGPTAVLTLVAAIWSRVEYQAKLVAPWVRLSQQRPARADRAVLLDYLSDFLPWSVFKAAGNGDYLVSAASLVTVLVKILIIISTGLITLSWTPVRMESYQLTLQDRFVDDAGRLGSDALPFFMMTGAAESNLSFPDGIYQSYAYQSLQSDLPEGAETRVIADAFETSLDCQPAALNLTWAKPLVPQLSTGMNFTVTSAGCHVQSLRLSSPVGCGGADMCTRIFGRFARIECDGEAGTNRPGAGEKMLLVMGNLTWTADYSRNETDYTGTKIVHPYLWKLNRSVQMVCTPGYRLLRVEVARNGTKAFSVVPLPNDSGQTKVLSSVSPWDIMRAHDRSHASSGEAFGGTMNSYTSLSANVSGTMVDTDPYVRLALMTQGATTAPVAALFDPERSQSLFTKYYQQITAIIAKQALMEPASIPVTGSAVVFGNRLVIRSWSAHFMVGLLATCILLTVLVFFLSPSPIGRKQWHRKGGVLPCSPSTLLGLAAILQNSPALLRRLLSAGAADEKALRGLLGDAKFRSGDSGGHYTIHVEDEGQATIPRGLQIKSLRAHPGIVHPATRVGLAAILLGLVIALELLLRKSMSEDGLGDVGDDTYLHYTWTTVPAVVLGTLAIIFSAMDFRMRALAPYMAMKRGVVGADTFRGLEFLDSSIPRAMYREGKLRNFGALAGTLALVISSLLTIFSASLFQPAFVEVTGPVSLTINESFSATPDLFDVKGAAAPFLTAGLILESNMSFPRFTYGDLAFPTFMLASEPSMDDSRTIPIHAVVPAVRSKLLCRSYDQSQMQLNWTTNATAPAAPKYPNTLGLWIAGEEECIPEKYKNSTTEFYKYNAFLKVNYPNSTHFALSTHTSSDSEVHGCSGQLYVWGKINNETSPATIEHIAAMGCNATYEALDVDVTFLDSSLAFDPSHPPVPRESTARLTTTNTLANFSQPRMYSLLPQLNTMPDPLDKFFAALTTSRWAVPRSALGDPSSEAHKSVTDSIRFHDAIIQAQLLAYARVPANGTNATIADPKPGESDDKLRFEGTAINTQARRRVKQDAVSTRILEALLGTLFVLLFAGWVFAGGSTDVLASSPTTIASRAAVIAGGNLLDVLPRGAAGCEEREIAGALGGEGARVWIGWDRRDDGGSGNVGEWEGGYKSEGGERRSIMPQNHSIGSTPRDPGQARAKITWCWQPHGRDKSFMWVRDALPVSVAGIRTITYGYDSKFGQEQLLPIYQRHGLNPRSSAQG